MLIFLLITNIVVDIFYALPSILVLYQIETWDKINLIRLLLGDILQVILTDYSKVRWYPSSLPLYFDALPQLNKYRSCGLWFEPLSPGQKLPQNPNVAMYRAKVTKVVATNNRLVSLGKTFDCLKYGT